MVANASFVSPTADATVAHTIAAFNANGVLSRVLNNLSGWQLVLTLILSLVAYDQCTSQTEDTVLDQG
jgi:C-22 sterol desaturase